jgi:hypothetical protein
MAARAKTHHRDLNRPGKPGMRFARAKPILQMRLDMIHNNTLACVEGRKDDK